MDNFRRHSNNRRQKPTFIDGFVTPNKKSPSPLRVGEPTNQRKSRSYPDIGKKKLDSIRSQPDGFFPRQKPGSIVPDGTRTGRRPKYQEDSSIGNTFADNESPKRTKKSKKRISALFVLRSFACLLIVGVLLSGFLFGRGYLRARQVFGGGGSGKTALNDETNPATLKGEGDGRINILMLAKGGEGHDGAELTDTILIASIDPIQKDAGMLSIPRDMWVRQTGSSMKINAVYATAKQNALYKKQTPQQAEKAGFDALESKVTEITGLPIHYHALVDFTGFKKAIDTVGGIVIDVPEALYDPSMAYVNGNNPLIAPKGIQQMNGQKALFYGQSRYGSARGDFDRNERQRRVLLALKDKILTAGTYGNPVKISQLLDNFGSHIQTNFSLDEIMRMHNLGKQIDSSKITSIGLADPPQELVTTGSISGQSVVIPRAGNFEYAAIRSFVRNTFKDGFLRKENPTVLVLNGTAKAGIATLKAEELKSYGYNVPKFGDAPTKDYPANVLIDLTNGKKKYTKRYLELRFKTSATTKLPEGITPETADFVIIVGQNGTTQN